MIYPHNFNVSRLILQPSKYVFSHEQSF
eukprot:COSAG02_NODE_26798_length_624_cov_0.855238_2_plen_27_part_01